MEIEYTRNLQSNYLKLNLREKPLKNRYQYGIVTRGGVRGLLECHMRFQDDNAYIYYDITSKQVLTKHMKRPIDRKRLSEFARYCIGIENELMRFLLDERNIIWDPDLIFEDPDSNDLFFVYVPYSEETKSFGKMLDFFLEYIDYEDEKVVELFYRLCDSYQKGEGSVTVKSFFEELYSGISDLPDLNDSQPKEVLTEKEIIVPEEEETENTAHGLLSLFESKRKKAKEKRETYETLMQEYMSEQAVCEDSNFKESPPVGKTLYISDDSDKERIRRLYDETGRVITMIQNSGCIIGKKQDEVDLLLDDVSVSRIHAKIYKEDEEYYIEDLNSTNGTYKNGFRLNPYEKRKLLENDEIKFGTKKLTFK